MERVRKVISWSNRSPEPDLALPPFFGLILASAEEIRPRLHDYRKQLERSTTLFPPSWGKFDSGTMCQNCPLWALIKTQEELVNAQRKFLEDSIRQLITNLKSWEEECSQLMKTKVELQKALMDMNKVRDKQRQGKDNESVKSLIALTESTYNSQRATLFKDLSHYLQSEMNYQARTKKFLEEQVNFLGSCKTKTDNLLNTICTTSAFAGETPLGSYFGSSLQDHLDEQGYSVVLKKCLSFLMKSKAYEKEGIFRVAGQVSHITLLRGAIDKDKADDSLLDVCGVDAVADVMKQYLRELPEPLLSSEFMENWPGKTSPSSKLISVMHEHLPEANRKNFLLLLQFLLKVYKNEETSKMSVDNLALTLWINLCPTNIITEGATAVKHLLTHAEDLVGEENSLDILESQPAAMPATTLKVGQTALRPQKLERTCPTRPSPPEVSQKTRPLPPPPPPPSAPNCSPHTSVNDVGNPPTANMQLGSAGGVPYQPQHPLSNAPVTAFDSISYRRTSNTSERNTKGVLETPPLATTMSLSGTFVEHKHSAAMPSNTELSRREGTSPHPAPITKDKAQKKENEEDEEEEADVEPERRTSFENSVSTETSTPNYERKNASDADRSKEKKHLKPEEDCGDARVGSDGIGALLGRRD